MSSSRVACNVPKTQASGACNFRRLNHGHRRLQGINASVVLRHSVLPLCKKHVSSGVKILKLRSSLFACNVWKAPASGTLNYRRFKECTVHSQCKCSVEACAVPPLKKLPNREKNYNKNGVKVKVTHRAGCMG